VPKTHLRTNRSGSPDSAAPVWHAVPPPPKVSAERKPVERARSEEYYDVKTTVLNALIDSIDDVRQASIAAGLKRPGAEQPQLFARAAISALAPSVHAAMAGMA